MGGSSAILRHRRLSLGSPQPPFFLRADRPLVGEATLLLPPISFISALSFLLMLLWYSSNTETKFSINVTALHRSFLSTCRLDVCTPLKQINNKTGTSKVTAKRKAQKAQI